MVRLSVGGELIQFLPQWLVGKILFESDWGIERVPEHLIELLFFEKQTLVGLVEVDPGSFYGLFGLEEIHR